VWCGGRLVSALSM